MWFVVVIIWILTAFKNKSNFRLEPRQKRYTYILIVITVFLLTNLAAVPMSFLSRKIIPNPEI